MISLSYVWNELRRRAGRTIVTAIGLAAGVGLVMGIIGVSQGLSDAQGRVLSPLSTVGTDIIVTRTVAPTTSTSTTTTTVPNDFGGPGQGRGAGGRFFAGPGSQGLNNQDSQALLQANSSVITDLAKLGPAGTKFTHDFFVPGTLITFPSQAITDVQKISGVESAVGALSLQAMHESGTVPKITATYKTGGQTLKTTVQPPKLTAAQRLAERQCIQKAIQKQFGQPSTNSSANPTAPTGNSGEPKRGPGVFVHSFNGISSNPAISKCMTAQQKSYIQNVVVPEQTITQVLKPPSTNTSTSSYTVGGVDIADPNSGLVTKAQLTNGAWLSSTQSTASHEVLVNTAYATQKGLHVGDTLTINNVGYKVVGLVNPTLTGDTADVYFSLGTLQSLGSDAGRVNEVLVKVQNSNNVAAVAKAIKKALPGATVLTSATLADQVTGSLHNAHTLASDLGTAVAIVVLLAAFAIAALLTLSSVAKRVREIGSLRAIGWSRGRVVRQIVAETLGIGILGGALGIGVGAAICAIIGAIGPGLSVTSTGLAVGASNVSSFLGQSTSAAITSTVHLSAPIRPLTILLAFAGALVGGLLAGVVGGWRAARLAPASALRDLG